MPYRKVNTWNAVDWTSIIIYLVLVVAGWLSIYGASYDYDNTSMFNSSGRAGQQLVWIGISLAVAFVILMLDKDIYNILAYVIYAFVILLLIATIIFAKDIKGSQSWLVIGPVHIQSAEFAKFAVALAVARKMSSYGFKLLEFKNFFTIAMLVLFPMLLILLQKETGSALVYLAFLIVLYREGMSGTIIMSGFCAVLFFIIGLKYSNMTWGTAIPGELWRLTEVGEFTVLLLIMLIVIGLLYNYRQQGKNFGVIQYLLIGYFALAVITWVVYYFYPFNLKYAVAIGLLLTTGYLLWLSIKYWSKIYLGIVVFIIGSAAFLYSVDYVFDKVLEPHQQIRIKVALGMEEDLSGAGYNVNQSKIAIGSGGFTGKGFLNGTQTKLKYVPEQDTDFIFCTVGEEQGFVGAALVLILFSILIIRLIILAERQKEIFNRVYGYSVASILFFHLAINIGMVIGLAPVIGIPLPFFSYGGSSLLGFTILLFIFLKLDAAKGERFL